MSVKVMGLVWEADLPAAQKLVLLSYADHADHDGNNVFPSVGLIAWKTGYSHRQVQRITRQLRTMKILVREKQPTPGGVNRYRIDLAKLPLRRRELPGDDNLTPPDASAAQQAVPEAPAGDDKMTPPAEAQGNKLTPPPQPDPDRMSPGGCQDDMGGMTECHQGGDAGVTQTIINHPLNHPLTEKTGAGTPAPPDPVEENPAGVKNPAAYHGLAQHEAERRTARENNDEIVLSAFPEDVRLLILQVCRLWGLRPPRKVAGKGGEFALWIKESRWLLDALGELGLDVLHAVHDDWLAAHYQGRPPFTVGHPGALIKCARAKAGELRSLQKMQPPPEYSPEDLAAAAAASEYFNNLLEGQKEIS